MYRRLTEELGSRVLAKSPDAYAWEGLHNMPNHVLWMLKAIPGMEDIPKASRWLGWCLSRMETMAMLTNEESRELVRLFRD